MNIFRSKSNQKGFTLIEAIVSTAVFAFVVSSVLGVYISVLRIDARTRAIRAITDNGRFIMDFLAKEIRNGRIDYATYPDNRTCKSQCASSYYATDMYLINQNNEQERIFFWDRTENAEEDKFDCRPVGDICDLYIRKGGVSTRLNSQDVRVTELQLVASPIQDPYNCTAPCSNNFQPFVIVSVELEAYTARDRVKINLQSTFSSKYYPNRP